ncbi:MAG: NUDIX hydrolase [Alphaproteobacteria bacterium]|nr:NUDIX hydrolase [Alphaproteobacteria bacterium]
MSDAPKQRPPRPRHAASLILYRKPKRGSVEILMGRRDTKTRFMPSVYVFPGGRVDSGDWHAREATPLADHVLARLTRRCSASRARAHAMAAVRETYEETGLLLGQRTSDAGSGPPSWRHFHETGYAPALHRLDYLARALTPANRPIRYDARFFLAEGTKAEGRLGSNGELHDLHWVAVDHAHDLPLPSVTTHMLLEIERYMANPPKRNDDWQVSFFSHRRGRFYHRYE